MSRLAESLRLLYETTRRTDKQTQIFGEIRSERHRQNGKWGFQHWPHYNPLTIAAWRITRDAAIKKTNRKAKDGSLSWEDILYEEFCEAMAETDWKLRRKELIQAAAVIVAEIEDGDLTPGQVGDGTSLFEQMGGTIKNPGDPC
jgi:hypothetical protein